MPVSAREHFPCWHLIVFVATPGSSSLPPQCPRYSGRLDTEGLLQYLCYNTFEESFVVPILQIKKLKCNVCK